MRHANILLAMALLGAAPLAHGALATSGAKTVTAVQVMQGGGFLVTFDSKIGGANGTCTAYDANGQTLYIYPGSNEVTADGAKAMLSAALTAFTSGAKLDVLYDNATPYCWGKNTRLTR